MPSLHLQNVRPIILSASLVKNIFSPYFHVNIRYSWESYHRQIKNIQCALVNILSSSFKMYFTFNYEILLEKGYFWYRFYVIFNVVMILNVVMISSNLFEGLTNRHGPCYLLVIVTRSLLIIRNGLLSCNWREKRKRK